MSICHSKICRKWKRGKDNEENKQDEEEEEEEGEDEDEDEEREEEDKGSISIRQAEAAAVYANSYLLHAEPSPKAELSPVWRRE